MNIYRCFDFNLLSKQIHQQNLEVGWWDDDPCILTKIQLINVEIAKATEAERKNIMDDHLPHRKGGEVELADALIKTLDLGDRLDLKYLGCEGSWSTHLCYGDSAPLMHLSIVYMVVDFASSYGLRGGCDVAYTALINAIIHTALRLDYDILGAMIEKLECNKNRPDHKRENRAQEGGKKW